MGYYVKSGTVEYGEVRCSACGVGWRILLCTVVYIKLRVAALYD